MELDTEHDYANLANLLDNVTYLFALGIPLLAIIVSCVISVVCVLMSNIASANTNTEVIAIKHKATVTILILTGVFIVLSVPNIVNYTLWTYNSEVYDGRWPGPIYNSPVMYYYSWNFTDVLCLALNATVNPVVLLLRIKYVAGFSQRGILRSLESPLGYVGLYEI